MALEYKQFTNEGFDVEGVGHGDPPSYDESNAIPSSAPPQNPYPPPKSLEYPMQQPSHSQQAAQFPQQQPGTAAPQPQVVQVPIQQNIANVSTGIAPNDYFAQALFVTLCCCMPFGIVALIKSREVKHRSAVGDYHGAALSSLEAKNWSKKGLLFGSISFGVSVVVIIYAALRTSIEYGY
ncbi:proline-rich transmembrane protein 1-like [Strongylocentrotus purpuratus]|uniref:Uncharacterized protein n=1 Tax=Strongylocentrotus purpuratus TaxID=7668 RepID=A0A7M7T284_STRPU|nr:proline-rich transmembrane protein 1-like [Strongylocentrotus purpuratus]